MGLLKSLFGSSSAEDFATGYAAGEALRISQPGLYGSDLARVQVQASEANGCNETFDNGLYEGYTGEPFQVQAEEEKRPWWKLW